VAAALFDLDRTLLDCNSGRLWVAHEWRAGRIGVRDAAWAAWWLAKYSLGVSGDMVEVFETAVAAYAGEDETVIRERTAQWFDAECAGRLRPGAESALRAHREKGDRLVLATSGTLYSALAALETFGLDDAVCTRMEVAADGRFTGKVASLAYGDAKLDRAREWAEQNGESLADCAFYTDSVTDAALLDAVGRPVVVNPDPRLARLAAERGWPVVDGGTA
jgi:putative phosphoserine phosphatase/1-acylglycerol-3-phosphate O-acyltransferase